MSRYLRNNNGGPDLFRIWSIILGLMAPVLLSVPVPAEWHQFLTLLAGAAGMLGTALAQFSSSPKDAQTIRELRERSVTNLPVQKTKPRPQGPTNELFP